MAAQRTSEQVATSAEELQSHLDRSAAVKVVSFADIAPKKTGGKYPTLHPLIGQTITITELRQDDTPTHARFVVAIEGQKEYHEIGLLDAKRLAPIFQQAKESGESVHVTAKVEKGKRRVFLA